jgi:hypothetical protein
MTRTDRTAAAIPGSARLLALDLAGVSGTLEEIATTWRRAWPTRRELPISLPLRLRDHARQLATDAREPATGPQQAPGRRLSVASRLSALEDGIVSAQAMTLGSGIPPVGDAGLWDSLDSALRRAGPRLPELPSA